MTHFVKYIQDYRNAINYDTAYSETIHKYLLKAFYRRTNKKEYKSQILEHNICLTNIIAMQDAILIVKVPVGSAKKKACCWQAWCRGYAGMQYIKCIAEV